MPVRIGATYPTTVHIDGEPVHFRVKRLTREEDIAFRAQYQHFQKVEIRQQHAERRAGDETLSDFEVQALREGELTPEALEQKRARDLADYRRWHDFLVDSIEKYVTADGEEVYDEVEQRWAVTGADLVRVFANRQDVLTLLMTAVHTENHLSADEKKVLSRLHALRRSSTAREITAGLTPETTAADASTPGSAESDDATAAPVTNPSGVTEILTAAG